MWKKACIVLIFNQFSLTDVDNSNQYKFNSYIPISEKVRLHTLAITKKMENIKQWKVSFPVNNSHLAYLKQFIEMSDFVNYRQLKI